MSFPFYLAAMRRPDLGEDPRFQTPELRLKNLTELHQIVQEWIWTFADMESLDAQLDEAKIATGQVRHIKEIAASDWASQWGAVRTVSDRSGGQISIPGRPWHFSNEPLADEESQFVSKQGEHNGEVLTELGYTAAEILDLTQRGALVQPAATNPATDHPAESAPHEDAAESAPHEDAAEFAATLAEL
jgi:crotonobetainyl-CoA:carnitine CoA-transferase CaiB-like acyl-CoA transferase